MKVLFYVEYPYYFPHFLPISRVFEDKGCDILYVLSDKQNSSNMEKISKENNLTYVFGKENLFSENTDVIFFANPFEEAEKLLALTVFLEHGVGTKSTSFYETIKYFNLYLVEGTQKYKRIKELYPAYEHKLVKVGFSKFDEIVNITKRDKETLCRKYDIDMQKKTILYAPTFFPSSIEKMEDSFPSEFSDCNILVKPHYLSYERQRYKNQLKKFRTWSQYTNCTILPLEEYSLVPFMAIADMMISDESSAMFEFAALNKPVVSNRFFKLRFSYYLMPWKLKKRIDKSKEYYRRILDNAMSYKEMIHYTKEAILNPVKLEEQRVRFSKDICGEIDGKVSERIYDAVCRNI